MGKKYELWGYKFYECEDRICDVSLIDTSVSENHFSILKMDAADVSTLVFTYQTTLRHITED